MADRFFINGGVDNSWDNPGNWSTISGGAGGASVPTASDNVFFDANSPDCRLEDTDKVCAALNFTGYTSLLTNHRHIIAAGDITLSLFMEVDGLAALISATTSNLTSGGFVWPNTLNLSGTATFTLVDFWIVGSLVIGSGTDTTTLNDNSIFVLGDLTVASATGGSSRGTTTIVMSGSGNVSTLLGANPTLDNTGGIIKNNFQINTGGTITFSDFFNIASNTFTYVAGTVIFTGSIFTAGELTGSDSCTIDVSANPAGITFDIAVLHSANVSLVGDIHVSGLLRIGGIIFPQVINGSDMFATGDVYFNSTIGGLTGTAAVHIVGTSQIVEHAGSNELVDLDIIIASTGAVTIGDNMYIKAGKLQVLSGAITTFGGGASAPF